MSLYVCVCVCVCVRACVCACVRRGGRRGGMLGRSVCLNLLLLAEKVMSASEFFECVLFPVFFFSNGTI